MRMFLPCTECDAIFVCEGDFEANKGQIRRLSSKPSSSCVVCTKISNANGGIL